MAECYDQDQEDRYRLLHRRLATAYRPSPPHRPDDDEIEPPPPVAAAASAASVVPSSAGTAHLFGGSFQFIVQEQAKSMVAIQELQQEVGSLLLFRQAVLAALPHLHQQQQQQPSNALLLAQGNNNNATKIIAAANTSAAAAATAAANAIIGGQSWTRRKQQHLQQQQQQLTGGGGGGYRSLQDGSSDQPTASAAITSSSSSNNPVVDSGFSTEASNSNTSPRSSRFDTTSSSEMTMSHHQQQQQQQQPMEKELLQHLERVQQRLARLKKDEDRLLTLLNLKRMANGTASGGREAAATANDDADELWVLLEEIQLRSQAMRNSSAAEAKDAVNKPEEAIHSHQQQSLSHKKRVSFQQQQQQLLETEGSHRVVVASSDSVDVLPSPAGKLSCSTLSSSSSSRYQPPSRDQVATILRLTNPVQLQRHLLRALLDNQSIKAYRVLLKLSTKTWTIQSVGRNLAERQWIQLD
ncbi:putative Mitogen-activated protein kinase erk-a [Daphnia magna]|uniref:Putative Mitogen-activated protein kinase erk-a n=1 Tax=Daphnia magna TaxID=35525 RepID=A0A162D9V8_9CRUS|nr:putative Mitogen-activated protein kinase erk-a [Daphnia magna]